MVDGADTRWSEVHIPIIEDQLQGEGLTIYNMPATGDERLGY